MLKHLIKHRGPIQRLTVNRLRSLTLRIMGTSTHGVKNLNNRLHLEKSPYLLQHASNPVNWYPWCQEAFDKAKSEEKPIFLSVGYSTCHWCHVMEKESFENEEISRILNEHFVSIKVDREERPDVDQVYMTFIQATTGHGGWPMSVWLTPDRKPIVGGTYFPPETRHGQTGLRTILLTIADKWEKDRAAIEGQGSYILKALKEHSEGKVSGDEGMPADDVPDRCFEALKHAYDSNKGGFGDAPKFPQPVNLRFLMSIYGQVPNSERGQMASKMCKHTMMMMCKGGIWDHISKGFHRYSTDSDWHVPHFEKMLYDQAQLAVAYSEAYQVTKEERFISVVKDILEYVNTELSHKSGGFYSAQDADSYPSPDSEQKKEGAFYVWKEAEIRAALTDPLAHNDTKTKADVFCYHFNVKPHGNVDLIKDPHGELQGENVLIELGDISRTGEYFGLTASQVEDILTECKLKLSEVQKLRPKPHLDSKMITAWNGLMLSGFAKASQVIGDPAYNARLLKAVEFIRTNLYDPETDVLYRSCYVGEDGEVSQISTPIHGFAEDYAYVIQGLIDAYEALFKEDLIEWAERLQHKMDELFWDEENGGYFTSRTDDDSVILRIKDDQDAAEPSANSIAASNLIRLSSFHDNRKWIDQSRRIFVAFRDRLQSLPHAVPEMIRALMTYQRPGIQIILVGDPEADDSRELLRCIHSRHLAARTLILADQRVTNDGYLYRQLSLLSTLTKIDNKATVYLCKNFTCSAPVNSVKRLEELLAEQALVSQ